MKRYKVIHFDSKGLAEPVRMLLAYGRVPFDDCRITPEEWEELKHQTPLGSLPVLEVDGNQLCQMTAICRYLARTIGIAGKNQAEGARCDMLVDGVNDIVSKMSSISAETDIELKRESLNTFMGVTYRHFLDYYERFLRANGSGYFVGDSVTWADIVIFSILAQFIYKPGYAEMLDAAGNHANLASFMESMGEVAEIKKHMATTWKNPPEQ